MSLTTAQMIPSGTYIVDEQIHRPRNSNKNVDIYNLMCTTRF